MNLKKLKIGLGADSDDEIVKKTKTILENMGFIIKLYGTINNEKISWVEIAKNISIDIQSKEIDTEMPITDNKQVDEKSVPIIQNLPPPPLPGQLPLPPAPGELGLPPPPLLEKTVECAACGSSLKVKDMTLRRMTCPICSEIIEM